MTAQLSLLYQPRPVVARPKPTPDGTTGLTAGNRPAPTEPQPSIPHGDQPGPQQARKTVALSSRERFEDFHGANPHVYRLLVRYAREAKAHGLTKIGIRLLWERARWDLTVTTTRAEDEPKLNDHLSRWYSREIMAREPDLAGFFEVRDR